MNHPSSTLVLMGECGRAQGLKGEVRVKAYTADPLKLDAYGALQTSAGGLLSIKSSRLLPKTPDMLIVSFEGVNTRKKAEALSRVKLYVERSKLPASTDDDFYLADLIGLEVKNTSNETIGKVLDVPNFGGGDLVEIKPVQGQSFYLPFTKAFFPVMALDQGFVVADFTETPEEPEE